jgi:Zn-dependent peptidase ImmA (M78 family)
LEKGVHEVFTSEGYQTYLRTMAHFHTYSINNSILIWMQRPDATLVAGYQAWKTQFNRNVRKGEKAIKIIAPIRRKKMYPVIIDNELVEDEGPKIIGWRAVPVFDIRQTYGDELPFYMSDVLPGMVNDFARFEEALILACPVPVSFMHIDSGAHGYYRPKDKDIVIDASLSEVQTIKTLLHEMTHAVLHHQEGTDTEDSRYRREVQAESVAYAVCSYYGIDTSEYSFPYIAGWSSSKDMEELKQSLQIIRETTDHLITAIERIREPVPKSLWAEAYAPAKKPEITL